MGIEGRENKAREPQKTSPERRMISGLFENIIPHVEAVQYHNAPEDTINAQLTPESLKELFQVPFFQQQLAAMGEKGQKTQEAVTEAGVRRSTLIGNRGRISSVLNEKGAPAFARPFIETNYDANPEQIHITYKTDGEEKKATLSFPTDNRSRISDKGKPTDVVVAYDLKASSIDDSHTKEFTAVGFNDTSGNLIQTVVSVRRFSKIKPPKNA